MEPSAIRVFDPLYGRLQLTPLESRVFAVPELQRLRYIRMCNINSMLITGASEISRFEHALGTLRLAREWTSHRQLPCDIAEAIAVAALLHDVQTGPFGHSFEYVLQAEHGDRFRHEDLSHGHAVRYHQAADASVSFLGRSFGASKVLGDLWPLVADMINGKGVYGPLISGTIDLDNIDNVFRLAYHVGVAGTEDSSCALQLARDLDVTPDGPALPVRSFVHLERWQRIRHDLYGLLLLDWADFSAKAMLQYALERVLNDDQLDPSAWKYTDNELLDQLWNIGIGEFQDIRDMVRRLRTGDLFVPLVLLESPDVETYRLLDNAEAKRSLVAALKSRSREAGHSCQYLVHFIRDVAKTDRAVDVIEKESGRSIRMGRDSNRLLIGLFTSRPVHNAELADDLRGCFRKLLDHHGVHGTRPIVDPVFEAESADMDSRQMELFD
ncbi:MAG: HD domain-containing protein [Planctomycetaceae bacterium]|nr:HD domain-containing protein [Planctomycetaceae bacterium]